MPIGYIVSRYPGISHTFIQREVLGLRNLGWEIVTISVRPPHARELLTEADREEAAGTHVLLPPGPLKLIAAVMEPLLFAPGAFFRAMGTAWKIHRPGLRGAVWTFFYFLEALLVHRLCRKQGIRHLHAHFANVAADVALIASVLNRRINGGGTFSFTMHGPTEFFDLIDHRLAEKTAAAKFVLCISDFARSQLMSLLPPEQWGKLEIAHCGVDPEQFAHPRQCRRDDTTPANLLCVARLANVKGHAVLLDALAELLMRGHAVTLTLAGEGPLRQSLERRADVLGIAEQVKFLGNVGQDVIHEFYARADAFVLPSFAEGVPVVLMEAMAAKCPVIATRIAGIPELIEHGISGLVVPPGRSDLLADAIERVLANRAAAERMAEAGAEKVKRDYNLHKIAPQIAAIFRRYLEPRAEAPRARAIDARARGLEPVGAEGRTPDHRSARHLQEVQDSSDSRGAA
jgi:glycosyltransferase involved in cell wall biosynthesis